MQNSGTIRVPYLEGWWMDGWEGEDDMKCLDHFFIVISVSVLYCTCFAVWYFFVWLRCSGWVDLMWREGHGIVTVGCAIEAGWGICFLWTWVWALAGNLLSKRRDGSGHGGFWITVTCLEITILSFEVGLYNIMMMYVFSLDVTMIYREKLKGRRLRERDFWVAALHVPSDKQRPWLGSANKSPFLNMDKLIASAVATSCRKLNPPPGSSINPSSLDHPSCGDPLQRAFFFFFLSFFSSSFLFLFSFFSFLGGEREKRWISLNLRPAGFFSHFPLPFFPFGLG